MAAFAEAVELGYRYLETDVHATRDGVLVAFHDAALDRVTDARGNIADLDWDDVGRARIAGREQVPLLEDVLDTWPQVRVNIDVKADSAVGPLVDLLRRGDHLERVCVGSFSDARLAEVRAAFGPALCTSAGPGEVRRLRAASYLGRIGRLVNVAAHCVQVPVSFRGIPVVDARFLAHCHDRGLPVHVWTINDPDEMHRLLDLGVDGIVSDETQALRDVLRERGAWPPQPDPG